MLRFVIRKLPVTRETCEVYLHSSFAEIAAVFVTCDSLGHVFRFSEHQARPRKKGYQSLSQGRLLGSNEAAPV